MISIAIIDIIGLTYDGTTLEKQGLGGSESAVILMSRELVKRGFSVTVFNNCIDKASAPGTYDGVIYRDHHELDAPNEFRFDVVISSRTVYPFLPEHLWTAFANFNPQRYAQIKRFAKHKVVWMHDTFCGGDQLIEDMVVHGDIDELFTLSDFHTSYVLNCDHGKRRNFEVLKRHVFMTRNGVVNYHNEIDVRAKDPHLYVYNASVTKGMLPLVNNIWPEIKKQIPQAKLKVIGGYYRFRENAAPDEQERMWRAMVADPKYNSMGIEFTGVIKQSEIADILAKASFMLFPGAFPETFGISTLESLTYNTPLIATRFGALEETAVDRASYFIDYAIEPNSLFPNIDSSQQESRFIQTVVQAHKTPYLHQQKMYACNLVKDVCTWDTIALQWKQHLFHKLGLYLSVEEYRQVSKINARVRSVFGRRFSNLEELYITRNAQQRLVVIMPFYNAESYIVKAIESVIAQDYDNYLCVVVDDCSSDNGLELAMDFVSDRGFSDKFAFISNDVNRGAVYNQVMAITKYCSDDDIVMLLDGDDALVADNQIFHFYNNVYDGTTEFTYGSCWSMVDDIPLIAQPYPQKIKQEKRYREYLFNWNMPYTHLRTFKARLIKQVDHAEFQDDHGQWFRAGGDGSIFYAAIENADPDKVKAIPDVVYLYNDKSPINDYKINGTEQTRNAKLILNRKQPSMTTKRILIAIPTNKYIEPETFKSIYDLQIPDGYEAEFQFFYGYQIDQIRNLIASWAERYDYLFSVDSDITFRPDTLTKMISHNVDVVSGLYIQRKPGQHILELYRGGRNIPFTEIKGRGLVEVDGCGFGCVLVKSEVIRGIGYPQFVYRSALDHSQTLSEDVFFCMKAKEKGFRIFADTTIMCEHIGNTKFVVEAGPQQSTFERLFELSEQRLLPTKHVEYLYRMKADGVNPKVVFDIGACVLHWTREAVNVWPEARFIAFEAMDESAAIFEHYHAPYHIGVLGDKDGTQVAFYQNTSHPGGNSYYRENQEINPDAPLYFPDAVTKTMRTLDSIVQERGFPQPDLIKMDVQGAELDILKGATATLKGCKDVILELQKVEYNKGAPLRDEVIAYMGLQGFFLKNSGPFCNNGPDGDYHFTRV